MLARDLLAVILFFHHRLDQQGITNLVSTQEDVRPHSVYGIWPFIRETGACVRFVRTYPDCYDNWSHLQKIHSVEDHSFSKYIPGVI